MKLASQQVDVVQRGMEINKGVIINGIGQTEV
jgi:hypothetical protein